jgi:hypothetical protein
MSVLKKEPSVASGKSNYAHGQGSSISDYNSSKSQEAMVRTQDKSTVASQPVASASSKSSMSVLKKAPPELRTSVSSPTRYNPSQLTKRNAKRGKNKTNDISLTLGNQFFRIPACRHLFHVIFIKFRPF